MRAFAVIPLSLAACGIGGGGPSGDDFASTEAALDEIPESVVGEAQEFLSSGFPSPSNDQQVFLRAAENELGNQCFTRKGLDWQAPPVPLAATGDSEKLASLDLTILSPSDYGLARDYEASLTDPFAADRDLPAGWPEPPAEWEEVQYGRDRKRIEIEYPDGTVLSAPVEGCIAEARAELYNMPIEDYERTRALTPKRSQLEIALEADGLVASATRIWGSCMENAGYAVERPTEIPFYIFSAAGLDTDVESGPEVVSTIAQLESRVAEADRECKSESGVDRIAARAILREGRDLIAESEAASIRMSEAYGHALDVATELFSN